MIKPVKRNKRLKWIESRYARPYKSRLFLRKCQVAMIVAQGILNVKGIQSVVGKSKTAKKLAIVKSVLATTTSINELLKQPIKGRITHDTI